MSVEVGQVSAAMPVAGAEPVAARAEATPLPLPAESLPSTAVVPGIKAEISTAARLLSTFLNHPAMAMLDAAPAGPLMETATPQAPAIAEALRSGIARSGLFYESHQAEWIAGARELAELRREPQATPASDHGPPDTTIPALVRQQLDMLDGQPLQWRGELWPGLLLHVNLQRDADISHPNNGAHSTGDEATETGWQGQIVSFLPLLGKITARLRITGDHLRLELGSAEQGSTDLITARSAELREALRSSGLTLDHLTTRRDEPA